jgi:predicted acylesterase/phospholipase RssA
MCLQTNNMLNIYGFSGSGGGAKGAWGAGVAHYLINDLNRDYKYLSGTSTGALQSLLISLNETERLKEGYTSVTNGDIYKLAPYRIKKNKKGHSKTKMNYLKIGWNMLIRKQKTFGDSSKLRTDLLPKFFTVNDFNKLNFQFFIYYINNIIIIIRYNELYYFISKSII